MIPLPLNRRSASSRLAVLLSITAGAGMLPRVGGAEAAGWDQFKANVQPFLQKHCYECHGEDDPENGFRLDQYSSMAAIVKDRKGIEEIFDKLSHQEMPPKEKKRPAPAEIAGVMAWLESHLQIDCTGPRDPGRVTLRRLNRAEYNNTIRDLLGIDFRPADAFPADVAGYGFDNNGDVLSVAPVLMEKYLAAAKLSLDKAIKVDPIVPPPLQRWEAATLEGTIAKTDPNAVVAASGPNFGAGLRRTSPIGRLFNQQGEIFVDYDFPADGEYVLRLRGYGTQGSTSKSRPQVAFKIDDQPVDAPFTIKEDQRNTSVYSLNKVRVTAGKHRVTLAFLNGPTAEEVATAAATAATAAATAPDPASASTPAPAAQVAVADNNDDNPAGDAPPARRARGPRVVAPKAVDEVADAAAADAAAPAIPAVPAAAGSNPSAPPAIVVAVGEAVSTPAAGGGAAPAGAPPRRPPGGQPQRPAGPPGSPTGKPTLGVIYMEAEGPLAPTPDRMPESYRRVMVAQPSAKVSKEQAAEKIFRSFARQAFRRPVRDDEVKQLLAFWAKADADGRSFDDSVHLTLQTVLASPQFLFRVELEPQANELDGIHTLNEHELATRLSYFIWSTMPDAELSALADAGRLRANLTKQVQRMLKDPRSQSLIENFAGQWLQLRQMQNVSPDAKLFPQFDEGLRTAMTKETELFFNAIMQEDRSVIDFLDADFTFLNERLAQHYGIPGIKGEEFRRVSLAGQHRGGILTHASVLTLTSYPGRTSPVQRGKWVLENLLDDAPPPPPPNVPALDEAGKVLTGTLRQRMEQHRANAQCASCHSRMDPIGFGLENYDAIGAWRTTDQDGSAIDASSILPDGRKIAGADDLKKILRAQKDRFARSMTDRLFTFALGRGLENSDNCFVDDIVHALKQQDYKFSVLVNEIVMSDPFQKRSGKTVKKGDL